MKLFLGGTCTSNWRKDLIPLLENDGIDYFNPIVDDWNEEAQKREYEEKNICSHLLYVITPSMEGVFSIAEIVDDSNKRPNKTIFVYMDKELDNPNIAFNDSQLKSLGAVESMVKNNGAFTYKASTIEDLFSFIKFINDDTRDIDKELNNN